MLVRCRLATWHRLSGRHVQWCDSRECNVCLCVCVCVIKVRKWEHMEILISLSRYEQVRRSVRWFLR
jgi:hypothetical protein